MVRCWSRNLLRPQVPQGGLPGDFCSVNIDVMSDPGEKTQALRIWLERLKQGDEQARAELLRHASDRLMHLTRKMKHGFERVGRYEQTEDVFQNASLRLWKALEVVDVRDLRHFFRLAAQQIRRELIDLARVHKAGGEIRRESIFPGSPDTEITRPLWDPADLTRDPRLVQDWTELHKSIEGLPDDQREVVDLVWYHGLTQEETAQAIGLSVRQVKRLWRAARLQLFSLMEGEGPPV